MKTTSKKQAEQLRVILEALGHILEFGSDSKWNLNRQSLLENMSELIKGVVEGRYTHLCECYAFGELARALTYTGEGVDPLLWEWGASASPFGRCSCKDR